MTQTIVLDESRQENLGRAGRLGLLGIPVPLPTHLGGPLGPVFPYIQRRYNLLGPEGNTGRINSYTWGKA